MTASPYALSCCMKELREKDEYTYIHSLHVAKLTNIFCSLLKVSKEETKEITIAAILHDVGKINVPLHILQGNSKLTEEEWTIMKNHAIFSIEYLKDRNFNDSILKNILCHHERISGTGYPNQLKENEIPFGAKIIAIADSLDAMLTNRSYRRKLSFEQAKEEIAKNAGIMYDNKMVQVILNNWNVVENYYSCDFVKNHV